MKTSLSTIFQVITGAHYSIQTIQAKPFLARKTTQNYSEYFGRTFDKQIRGGHFSAFQSLLELHCNIETLDDDRLAIFPEQNKLRQAAQEDCDVLKPTALLFFCMTFDTFFLNLWNGFCIFAYESIFCHFGFFGKFIVTTTDIPTALVTASSDIH